MLLWKRVTVQTFKGNLYNSVPIVDNQIAEKLTNKQLVHVNLLNNRQFTKKVSNKQRGVSNTLCRGKKQTLNIGLHETHSSDFFPPISCFRFRCSFI